MTSDPGSAARHDSGQIPLGPPPAPPGNAVPPGTGSTPPGPPAERDHWSLAQKLVALFTALLTLATAALGLWGAQAKSERDELQERSDGLESELSTAVQQRDAALGELDAAEARIAELEAANVIEPIDDTSTPVGGPVQDEPTYLADLDSVEGQWFADDELQIDGTEHLHGVRANKVSACSGSLAVRDVEYSIDRKYTTFTAVVGVSDESISGLPVEIAIAGDGREMWSQTVQVGTPQVVELDVTGILRLKITATRQFDDTQGCPAVYGALGDPTLE